MDTYTKLHAHIVGQSIRKTLGLHTNTHIDIYKALTQPQVFANPCPLTNTHPFTIKAFISLCWQTDYLVCSFLWILSINIKPAKWPALCLWVSVCVCVFSGRQVTGRWFRSQQALDQTIMTPLLSPLIVYGWIKEPVSRGTHSFSLHTWTEGHT